VLLALVPTSKSPPLLRTIESVAKLQINKSFSTELALHRGQLEYCVVSAL
jgi:hypothetical protein